MKRLLIMANLPDDAIYPVNFGDETAHRSMALTSTRFTLTKAPRLQRMPFGRSRSTTLMDSKVANILNRFAVSSWMPFKYNADGSLNLYFQHESPGNEKEANWLPAPRTFNLTMRLYAPKTDALTGKWNPPPVIKTQALPSVTAQ